MPGFLTDYACNRALDHLFQTPPDEFLWVGLSRLRANKTGLIEEPEGCGYARVRVPFNGIAHAENGSVSNTAPITFATPTGHWGAIACLFVATSENWGYVLGMADLSPQQLILAGDPAATVQPGALYVSQT
jgi:hypothetical protein